jgi:hypothetical protein
MRLVIFAGAGIIHISPQSCYLMLRMIDCVLDFGSTMPLVPDK